MSTVIDIEFLKQRAWPGLTEPQAGMCVEAASVCLEDNGKPLQCSLILRREDATQRTLQCQRIEVTARIRAGHHDLQEATEWGATAFGILLSFHELSYEVVRRSRKGTGYDYWLSKGPAAGVQPFEAALEVSGILKDPNAVAGRVKEKQNQAGVKSQRGYPVVIAVTEFSTPIVWMEHHP